MGVIIIGPDGEEIENTYKRKEEKPEIRRDDYIPPQPALEIIPEPEPMRIPYMPFINPDELEEEPLIDKDFGVPLPKKKIPDC